MSTPNETSSSPKGHSFFSGLMDKGRHAVTQAQAMASSQAERYRPEDPSSYEDGSHRSGLPASFNELRQHAVGFFPGQSPHTLKLQQAIVAQKGCATTTRNAGKTQKVMATQLFQWAQDHQAPIEQEAADVVDVGDRLAWVLFKQGEIEQTYAAKVEQARAAFKDVRNFESKLGPQRDARLELRKRIQKMTDQKADESKISAAEGELARLNGQACENERSVLEMKRMKMKEAFSVQFHGLRQMGEELSILSSYGELLLDSFTVSEPGQPPKSYTDFQRTLAIRDECDKALANYPKAEGLIPKPSIALEESTLSRTGSTISSFGQTHKGDIDALTSGDGGPSGSAAMLSPALSPEAQKADKPQQGPDLTSHLNNTPVAAVMSPPHDAAGGPSPAPGGVSSPMPGAAAGAPPSPPAPASGASAPIEPTVAETGIPASGTNGPAEGQLKPRRPSQLASGMLPPAAGTVDVPGGMPEEEAVADEGADSGRASTSATKPPAYTPEDAAAHQPGPEKKL